MEPRGVQTTARHTIPLLVATLVFGFTSIAARPQIGGEPGPGAVLAELPFLSPEKLNRIYIDLAKPNSRRRLRVLLDTGAAFSVFTPGAAREIGVRPKRLKPDPYRRATLLGRDLQFYIDTLSSDTGSKTGWEYGLLGGNFLDEYVLELDFPGRRVRFLDPDAYVVPKQTDAPGEAVLPLQVVSSRPGVEVSVNGHAMTVLLDTGAPSSVMLSGDLARDAGVASAPEAGFTVGGVLLAEAETELGEIDALELGPFRFDRVPVVVAPQGWFNMGYPGDSIIGYDVLAGFTVRIDYPRRRLWLRQAPERRMTFFGGDAEVFRAGALLQPGPERTSVAFVRPGSAAERRGLEGGDQIVAPSDPAELARALRDGGTLSVRREVAGSETQLALTPGEPTPDVAAPSEEP